MDRFWIKSYPPGVPAEVDVRAFRSIVDMFERSVAKYGEKPAFVQMGVTLSFAELDRLSGAFCSYLQQELKFERGTRIALMMPNVLQYPITLFGALRGGYVVVNCSPLYTARELERQLADSGAEAIVVLENFASVVEEALPKTALKHVIVTELGDLLGPVKGVFVNFIVKRVRRLVPAWRLAQAVPYRRALREGASRPWCAVDIEPSDLAFLQYTGGTTGTPKGAALTQGNIVANVEQHHAFCASRLPERQVVVLTAIPLFHIYAMTVSCLIGLKIGATNVLIANPRDIRGLIKELKQRRFTCFPGVNALFKALLACPDLAEVDFSSLSLVAVGGAPLEEAVAKEWKRITGTTIVEAYGLTEASPAVACNPMDVEGFSGSVGLPIPSTDIAIRGEAGGDVPIGEAGELCVRGPQIMQGYWNRPLETRDVDDGGRVFPHRRHCDDRRRRIPAHRRSQEGHDQCLGDEGVSDRGRGGRADASPRGGGWRHRRAGRGLGRGGENRHRRARGFALRRRCDRALSKASLRLQDPAPRRIPFRAAQDPFRQGSAPRLAGAGLELSRRRSRRLQY